MKKRTSVFHRAFTSKLDVKKFVPPIFKKDPEDTQALENMFKENFLTKNLDKNQFTTLADAMSQKKFEADQIVIRYGSVGSEYFVLSKGRVRVTVYEPGTEPNDPNLA